MQNENIRSVHEVRERERESDIEKDLPTIDNADELPGWTRNRGRLVFARDRLFVVRGREFHATIQNEREGGCQRSAFVNFEFVFCFVIIILLENFNVKRVIYYIYNRRYMSSFFPSGNKYTLCRVF